MQFIKSADWEEGTEALTKRLVKELEEGRSVLWLVCGGSNIPVTVSVMKELPEPQTSNLTILLTDERYGPVGHEDSNHTQLLEAGFEHKQATLLPVLVPDASLEATRTHYEAVAKQAFTAAEVIIGQFGIGTDGHIAGILPGSSAVGSPDFVAGYETPEFTRLTLTSHALKRLHVAYALVFGNNKFKALERLHDETLPFAEQPSQILKELPEAYVYNDQIGEGG